MNTHPAPPIPQQSGRSAALADLRCLYRRHGLRELLRKLIGRVRSLLFSREEVVVLRKDLREITEMEFSESLRIEELTTGDLPALFEFNRRRCDSKANGRAVSDVRSGYRGFAGYVEGELVGYYWWVDRRIEPRHRDIERYALEIELDDRGVYGFDFFLLEEHRGGGNSVEFLHKVESRLRDRGYETLWGYVVADNKPARWLYSMCGYKPVRRVASSRVLSRRLPVGAASESLETQSRESGVTV
ncbi:MAG: GNAT family N-acetyltransferase [Thermoleophilaceae bacterium]|nr:GNAT family N-acetyltransferase [Thermoleophilaceae bacterium]